MALPSQQITLNSQVCFPLYVSTKEVIRQYSTKLAQFDLTYTQYIVMLVLWEKKEIAFAELAKKVYLDSGTLTPLLKKLEIKGFINRTRSTLDERKVILSLTDKGAALYDRVAQIPSDIRMNIDISKEDLAELREIIERLMDKVMDSRNKEES